MFILGQTILTNTILPTQEVQLREGVSYSNNYRFNKGHMINGEESSKTFEENKTLTKSAEKKIEPIINSRVEVYNKNNIKHNINLSIAMILVGGSLFLYNKKYLNKI
jgi:hypothetical protein